MEVPKKISVENSHGDYFSDSDDDDYSPPRINVPTTTRLMSPPEKLTLPEITDEERRRFMRDSSIGNLVCQTSQNADKTFNGDPVTLSRQISHLHNRIKLLEEDLRTYHNRQVFLLTITSTYIILKGVKWMFK